MDHEKIKKFKETVKKVWNFLVHEDSWASFFVDAILIVLIAKFLIFPGIGLALNTEYPVVAVVSKSMDHHGASFDDWWSMNKAMYDKYGITKQDFEDYYKSNGFKKGDVFVVKGIPSDKLEIGDIIVYDSGMGGNPIIHRIVSITEIDGKFYFETKGDANSGQLEFEKKISEDRVYGKAVAWAPIIGWFKVAFVDLISAVRK